MQDRVAHLRGRFQPQKSETDLPSILRPPQVPHEPLLDRIKWPRVLVLLAIAYLLLSFMYGAFSILDLKDQENTIRTQLQAELREQARLKEEIAYLQTDEAVEALARKELGMAMPGEVLVAEQVADGGSQVPDDSASQDTSTEALPTSPS